MRNDSFVRLDEMGFLLVLLADDYYLILRFFCASYFCQYYVASHADISPHVNEYWRTPPRNMHMKYNGSDSAYYHKLLSAVLFAVEIE